MNSVELLDKKSLLKEKAYRMIDTAKEEIRNFTETEFAEYNTIIAEITNINEELRALEVALSPEITNELTNKPKLTMEKRNFSLLKAVRSCANNVVMDDVTAAVCQAGGEEMRKAGLSFSGQIQIPSEMRAVTVAGNEEHVIDVELMDIVRPLQAKNVMVQAGAKYLSGLVGDVKYPVMSALNCAWEGETTDADESTPTFSDVKFTPHRLSVVVPISKQFLVQDSIAAENAIREEIINAINAKLEATILGSGAGDANTPAGIFHDLTEINDYAGLCNFEAGMEEANVYGDLKYILAPKAKSAFRNMAKSTKSTQLVYENGEVDGTPSLSTSHVGETMFAYGDFSQFVIAQWGALDIVVDNYTLASQGQVRLVVNCFFDAKALRPEAIKVGKVIA